MRRETLMIALLVSVLTFAILAFVAGLIGALWSGDWRWLLASVAGGVVLWRASEAG
jgi:hypothetical protein